MTGLDTCLLAAASGPWTALFEGYKVSVCWKPKSQSQTFLKDVFFVMWGSSYNMFVEVQILQVTLVLFCYLMIKCWMIDSWDWLVIGWSAGPHSCCSISWSTEQTLAPKVQDGRVCKLDILATFLDIGRK